MRAGPGLTWQRHASASVQNLNLLHGPFLHPGAHEAPKHARHFIACGAEFIGEGLGHALLRDQEVHARKGLGDGAAGRRKELQLLGRVDGGVAFDEVEVRADGCVLDLTENEAALCADRAIARILRVQTCVFSNTSSCFVSML